MFTIADEAQVNETRKGQFSAEASSIRLPIGDWPKEIKFRGKVFGIVNLDKDEGDVRLAEYASDDRQSLTVFND